MMIIKKKKKKNEKGRFAIFDVFDDVRYCKVGKEVTTDFDLDDIAVVEYRIYNEQMNKSKEILLLNARTSVLKLMLLGFVGNKKTWLA